MRENVTKSSFQASVIRQKPKPKYSLWPIAKDAKQPIGQSKLEETTCLRHKARENLHLEATDCFGFSFDWLRKWREFFKPITKLSYAKPNQTRITFDFQVKMALVV